MLHSNRAIHDDLLIVTQSLRSIRNLGSLSCCSSVTTSCSQRSKSVRFTARSFHQDLTRQLTTTISHTDHPEFKPCPKRIVTSEVAKWRFFQERRRYNRTVDRQGPWQRITVRLSWRRRSGAKECSACCMSLQNGLHTIVRQR